MLTIEFSVNILVLALIALVGALVGYRLRGIQISRNRTKIEELQREILNNYAEILALEKENISMETKLQDYQIPVISIKSTKKDEAAEAEKSPDIALRKKLLSRENMLQHSLDSK
jgi:hypothetical protein